ncbi:MAG: hypothetical protein JRE36_06625 [Deltaproteobacteria bacterium]|nr:hypothetical protein [Deltaproteobacteria bacterium]
MKIQVGVKKTDSAGCQESSQRACGIAWPIVIEEGRGACLSVEIFETRKV